MSIILIHKENNAIGIDNFQCTIDAFQKLEPAFVLPENYIEILYNDDTNQANYIKTEYGLEVLDESLKNILSTFPAKIQEYELTLTTPIYKKNVETAEIKQFAFIDTIDTQIWTNATTSEITQHLLSIAKNQKIAEVENVYKNVKNIFVFILNYQGTLYKYNDYKASDLIDLCNQKVKSAQGRSEIGIQTTDAVEFTTNNEFKFRLNGFILNLTQEKLIRISLYLQDVLRQYYDRKKDMITEINEFNDILLVENYQISFAGLNTEHDFTNIIFP
jgi:hypothetical protein